MAKFLTAKFENREKVMARLNKVLPETEKELAAAQLEAGRELADRIRGRAPVRTGRYRQSIEAARLVRHQGQERGRHLWRVHLALAGVRHRQDEGAAAHPADLSRHEENHPPPHGEGRQPGSQEGKGALKKWRA